MTTDPVRRRQVFFFNGFDPKGAAFYHRLYADGARYERSAELPRCEVGPRERTDERHVQCWSVRWTPQDDPAAAPVDTRFDFMSWDDIVRAHWPRHSAGVAAGALRGYASALASGLSLVKVWRLSRRTLAALVYPAVFWLLTLFGGLLLGWLVLQLGLHWGVGSAWPRPAVQAGAAAAALLSCAGVWWCALQFEARLHTGWLLRIYDFTDLWAKGRLPDLEQRLDAMATRVVRALEQADADEVLLVGYSVGSMLSASVMARVLVRIDAWPPDARRRALGRLSMLTLGQCIPLLGLMPQAHDFRRQLGTLAREDGLRWTDYSSPGDVASFALVDPLSLCGATPVGGAALQPSMRSPRFHTLFDSQQYADLRRDRRRLHLQYLMPTPLAGGYDFFRLTAGPARLQTDAPMASHVDQTA